MNIQGSKIVRNINYTTEARAYVYTHERLQNAVSIWFNPIKHRIMAPGLRNANVMIKETITHFLT